MASVSPAEELELLQLIADAQTANYLAAAGITVLVFEHISTFSDEVLRSAGYRLKLILNRSSSYGTAVSISGVCSTSGYPATYTDCPAQLNEYPQIRYFTLTVVAHVRENEVIERGNVYLHSGIGQRGFCARLAGLDTIWEIATLVVYLVEIIALLTTGTLTIIPLKEYLNIGSILKGCYSLTVPRYFTFYAVPYLVMATLMFSMTLYKCSEHLFAVRGQRMPVITLFLRDGVFLFLTILVYSIVELTIWHNGRPTLAQIPVMQPLPFVSIRCLNLFGIRLHAVVGARILLNIKGLATEVSDDTIPTIELSDISYRRRPLAAKARVPWYLQTGEPSNSEGLSREID
ncbi:hypothetical protein K438DRAFT_1970737 [Mycena galopus ATCC 62051]|nr:hypothetical protein K438DRAFT_1970737 [Mycena galopus ATCC 62051]